MKRRVFLGMPFSLAGLARAEEKPWAVRLLKGGFDGKYWWMGFSVNLAPGWKTYWRVPGDGGVAPDLTLVGGNLKSYTVFHPLPKRFEDAAGMTIGYKDKVVFPIRVEPENPRERVLIQFNSFIGVCDVVCIPAQTMLDFEFNPQQPDMRDQAEISQWRDKVPEVTATAVTGANAVMKASKPVVQLSLSGPVSDVFVEGPPTQYYGKPSFGAGVAELPVGGAKTVEDVRLYPTRITLDVNGKGLEQIVTVV